MQPEKYPNDLIVWIKIQRNDFPHTSQIESLKITYGRRDTDSPTIV